MLYNVNKKSKVRPMSCIRPASPEQNGNEMENDEERGHTQCQPHAVTRASRSLLYLCCAYTRHAPWPAPTDPPGALAVRSNPNTCRCPLLSSCRASVRTASLMHMAAPSYFSTGPDLQMIHPMLGYALLGYAMPTTASIAKGKMPATGYPLTITLRHP